MYINLVVEDNVHEFILRKVLETNPDKYILNDVFGKRGNNYIKQKLSSFNQASKFTPYLVLTDLDAINCPPELIQSWINFQKSPNLIFRIAVKEAEAWLLGDKQNFSSFLGISANRINDNPESIPQPKEHIVQLARDSRKRKIREDLIPQGTAIVGRNYNSCLGEFIFNYWDVNAASQKCNSLKRLIKRLKNFEFEN